MFIQTEETPNPQTLKFLLDQKIMADGKRVYFTSAEKAGDHPLVVALFLLEGVSAVFFDADFIAITKTETFDWPQVKPDILGVLTDFFTANPEMPEIVVEEEVPPSRAAEGEDAVAAKIREIIETRVRPAVAQDGGDILLERYENGVAYLTMRGACSGCPSATITLKNGVENLLRYYVPELVRVEASESI